MLLWYVAFLFSVTAHEAAHAFVAMKGGDLTAYRGGQVSLNPLPHIKRSPFGTVLIPIISYAYGGWMIGWASAPYDPYWAIRHPRRASLMAAAGPTANLLIFLAALLLIKAGLFAGLFRPPQPGQLKLTALIVSESGVWIGVAKLLSILFVLNLILFLFNLFPFPPLDGSGVVTLLMPQMVAFKFTRFVSQPMYSLLGLILAWRLFGYVFQGAFSYAFRLIYP
ncbi:MAG: site-2 protease family protein [Calditrichaeota bacterium]|nr:MAG: site-2 protease family protein [Calditrichota bacterium]